MILSKHSHLVRSALEYFSINNIFAWENNTGALKADDRFIRFGQPGSSDILGCLPDGRFLAAEAKVAPDKQSKNQLTFEKQIVKNQGLYILFYDVADLHHYIRRAGYSVQIPNLDIPPL